MTSDSKSATSKTLRYTLKIKEKRFLSKSCYNGAFKLRRSQSWDFWTLCPWRLLYRMTKPAIYQKFIQFDRNSISYPFVRRPFINSWKKMITLGKRILWVKIEFSRNEQTLKGKNGLLLSNCIGKSFIFFTKWSYWTQ